LVVNDPRLGINVIADIQNYRPLKSEEEKEEDKEKIAKGQAVSSVPIEWEKQKQAVLDQVAAGMKLRRGLPVPDIFMLDDDRIGPSQVFYRASIRRAFDGRASPDDMIDTVRLAVWSKLTKPHEAALYMRKWFGQDCNAFVSNYLGVAPYFSIEAYAKGYGNQPKISGGSADVYAARSTVPLQPRTEFADISTGDVLVTFGQADYRGVRWRHIALVESWTLDKWSDDEASGIISIAEWGNKGGMDAHRSIDKRVLVRRGKLCPALDRTVIAFPSDLYGSGAIRLFLNATPLDKYESRGFLVANVEGV
jgi:hypothetical protein